jgi:uncharacterized protein (TIGR00255 family)
MSRPEKARRPIHSMTGSGLGRSASAEGGDQFVVEVRSVNGKGLTVKARTPHEVAGAERLIDERVRSRLHRGSVLVQVALQRAPSQAAELIDEARFGAVAAHLRRLAEAHGLAVPTVTDVLRVPGVVTPGAPDGLGEETPAALADALDQALDALVAARAVEGAATAATCREQLTVLAEGLAVAEARAPELVAAQRERLIERVNEFLSGRGLSIEPDDVVRELAVFAEKTDVAEEIQRLRAHIARAHELLEGGGEVGRRFDFLVQEMLRETNTLGSKSPDVQIAHTVVAMKTAIDRLKEQAANLE